MKIYNVMPRLEKPRHLALWHKAQESQWSARSIHWSAPQRITDKGLKDKLARVLSPILMSEQTAFNSASMLMPLMADRGDVESQYYLSTWLVDEGRHAELFARMFRRLDRTPMSARRFPAAYVFQHQVMDDDPGIWLAGLLAIENLAQKVMTEFRRLDLDPALSEISDGILADEARHLGFNRVYIEDRIADLHAESPEAAAAFSHRLNERLDVVLAGVPTLFDSLRGELRDMGFRTDSILDTLPDEARSRMRKSIESGAKLAAERAGAATT